MIIQDFVIKVVSRCNLNCSYCYMYNMGDTTYRNQPKFMSFDVIKATAVKLNNHCVRNNTKHISIVFHGGEPLLADKSFYTEAVSIFNTYLQGVDISFQLQSNGTLIDKEWIDLLNSLNVQVGISIDGPELFQNKFRVYHNNKGSYDDVIQGIRIRDEFSVGGLIGVVNADIPPSELYDFFLFLNAKRINLLLPDNHYDNLPKNKRGTFTSEDCKYGDWFIELYKLWSEHESLDRPSIPFFENIIGLILGFSKGDELIGHKQNAAITIETNGDIEVVDPLRICGNGFTRNRINVMRDEISAIESSELFQEYYFSHTRLSDKCNRCPVVSVCGGGYLGHRFSNANRFSNPSIYCVDLMKLITYIQNDITRRLPQNVLDQLSLETANYEDIYKAVYKSK